MRAVRTLFLFCVASPPVALGSTGSTVARGTSAGPAGSSVATGGDVENQGEPADADRLEA